MQDVLLLILLYPWPAPREGHVKGSWWLSIRVPERQGADLNPTCGLRQTLPVDTNV